MNAELTQQRLKKVILKEKKKLVDMEEVWEQTDRGAPTNTLLCLADEILVSFEKMTTSLWNRLQDH